MKLLNKGSSKIPYFDNNQVNKYKMINHDLVADLQKSICRFEHSKIWKKIRVPCCCGRERNGRNIFKFVMHKK